MTAFSDSTMRQTAEWAMWLARDWKAEFPTQLHVRSSGPGGTPAWHPDFERWMTARHAKRQTDRSRMRTTRVMRKLRQAAVREYEVVYRVLILDEKLIDTTAWLNERALRNNIPFPDHRPSGPHYTGKDTWALLIAGIDYARTFW